jgi:hypothetical protein
MAEIIRQNAEVILTSEELKKLEAFQSRIVENRGEFDSSVVELASIIDRHYFNRENGFLDDQQKNLREVVLLQSRIEKLAGDLSSASKELKSFMMSIQKKVQGDLEEAPSSPPKEAGDASETEIPPEQGGKESSAAGEQAAISPAENSEAVISPQDRGVLKDTPLVIHGESDLLDEKTKGGEISIKRLIDELHLRDQKNRDTLYQINTQLKELLYNRKLIGYSATSMVFGRDKTLAQLLEDLQPIFLSDALRDLLVQDKYVGQGELESLRLACDNQRELVYSLA